MPSKGTTSQRGYGHHHRQLRQQAKTAVDAGRATCWRCGQRIVPGSPWDLGHSDDRTKIMGPEHQHCNRATCGRDATTTAADASRQW